MIPLIFHVVLGDKGVKNIIENNSINWKAELSDDSLYGKAGFTLDAVINKTDKIELKHLEYIKAHIRFLIIQKMMNENELDLFEDWFQKSTVTH
jgi:hypothetical protein